MMNTHNSFKVFGFTVNFYAATEDEILLKKKSSRIEVSQIEVHMPPGVFKENSGGIIRLTRRSRNPAVTFEHIN